MAETWNVKELLEWTTRYFLSKGIENARLEAELLLAYVLKKDRVFLYTAYTAPVNSEERALYREVIQRRSHGEPLAYITGVKEFMSLPFQVDRRVLIPRPDTEILVEAAIAHTETMEWASICDVGSGSGAIAVSLAYYCQNVEVWAVDISNDALALAKANAENLDLQIRFIRSDLLADVDHDQRFDIIVANLPYISNSDYEALESGIKDYEPATALKAGVDGLDYYRRLAGEAPAHLKDGGWLLVEIDPGQAPIMKEILEEQGFGEINILTDLAGRYRVIEARRDSDR